MGSEILYEVFKSSRVLSISTRGLEINGAFINEIDVSMGRHGDTFAEITLICEEVNFNSSPSNTCGAYQTAPFTIKVEDEEYSGTMMSYSLNARDTYNRFVEFSMVIYCDDISKSTKQPEPIDEESEDEKIENRYQILDL